MRRRFTKEEIADIRRRRREGEKIASIAHDYGAADSTISNITLNKTYCEQSCVLPPCEDRLSLRGRERLRKALVALKNALPRVFHPGLGLQNRSQLVVREGKRLRDLLRAEGALQLPKRSVGNAKATRQSEPPAVG